MISAKSRLAEPITLGRQRLRNRIIGAPMERNLSTSGGEVTPAYTGYLAARAEGGAALLFTEAAYVRADGKGRARQMGIHEDRLIGALSTMADAVHASGALLGVELNHGGRTAQGAVSGYQCVAPSPLPCEAAGGEMPLQLEDEEIHHLISCFADAARRCRDAGVDVITIHAAHGYLVHQFLSPRTNLRTDEWAEPTRFLNEVITAVRNAVPDGTVGIRISAFEGPEDGLDADMTLELIGRAPLDRLDLLDISAGSYEAGQWIVQPGEWEEGILGRYAEPYRQFGLPVSVAGRISRRRTAERLLERGQADLVSVARALHADPGWAGAVTEGRTYRPCIACNLCIDELGKGDPVPCSVNSDVGREYQGEPPPSETSERVVVVGAGPAGLEAARRCAVLGHEVLLLERDTALGGQFRLAAGLHEYPEYHRILDWYAAELPRLGVDVRLGTDANSDHVLGLHPDSLVVATGGGGVVPNIPGVDHPRVVEIRSWLHSGAPDLGTERHIVWGADREGVAVADELVTRGKRVLIVGVQESLAPDVGRRAKILVVPRLLQHPAVEVLLDTRVDQIDDATMTVRIDGDVRKVAAPGPILLSQGVTPRNGLAAAMRAAGYSGRVQLVGDAGGEGAFIATAIAGGAQAARILHAGAGGGAER